MPRVCRYVHCTCNRPWGHPCRNKTCSPSWATKLTTCVRFPSKVARSTSKDLIYSNLLYVRSLARVSKFAYKLYWLCRTLPRPSKIIPGATCFLHTINCKGPQQTLVKRCSQIADYKATCDLFYARLFPPRSTVGEKPQRVGEDGTCTYW